MFSVVAQWSELLGGDIDREYCLKLYDTYPQTSEPELLAGYTKVSRSPLPLSPHLKHPCCFDLGLNG